MRRILVALKRVIDFNVRIHLHEDGSGVVTDGVKMSVNPFCEIALEAALRLRENDKADEVIVTSIGAAEVVQQLRTGLAMGADRAVHIESADALEPLDVARCLLALARRETPDIVLLGKQAIDSDNNQTAQLLAGLWGRPQATFASDIDFVDDWLRVAREVDHGTEVLDVEPPAVISADLRLNEPRYVKLPQLLKAKKQAIETLTPAEVGVELKPQFEVLETLPPPARPPGRRIESADELVAELVRRELVA
jgi:electron transfer flavoprotein beta subunit